MPLSAEEALRYIAARAHCVLWHAEVEDRGGRYCHWTASLADEDGAQRFLPLDVPQGKTYLQAWYAALLPEDREARDEQANRAVRAGEGYRCEYRCRQRDGRVRWLCEDVQVQVVGPGRWRAVGLCTDLTERREAEAALRESEARYRVLVEQAGEGIWLTSVGGVILEVNDSACRMLDYEREELVGRNIGDLLPPEDRLRRAEQVAAELGGGTLVAERRMRRKDGQEIRVEGRGRQLDDGRLLTFTHDVTASREAEEARAESEARFRTMADTAPVLIWMNGPDSRCEFVNRRYLEFLGRPLEEVLGEGWATAVHPDDADEYLRAYQEAFVVRQPFAAQFRFRRADGEYRWLRSVGVPRELPDGSFAGYIGSCLDITDLRQAEETLREEARRKDEFLAMLAHELRNPLAPIVGAVEVLRLRGPADPVLQRQREIIERQARHLARLVDDLLEIARITEGKIELRKEQVDLAQVIEQAVGMSRPFLEARRHRLEVTMPPEPLFVEADPARLVQVVTNLLNNAARYTESGGRVAVECVGLWVCGCAGEGTTDDGRRTTGGAVAPSPPSSLPPHPHTPTHAEIRVRDNGRGIAPELLPRLFDLFVQGDRSLARTEGGLGIGLTMVKRLVELHGGTVEARSDGPGRGSEFTVRLPILRDEGEGMRDESGLTHPSSLLPHPSHRRVLLVEDNADAAETLAELLQLWGHEVLVAADGPAALRLAGEFRPDVVLLDIGLPDMDGYEVARQLTASLIARPLLVALTGYGQEEDRRRAREAGFDHHLTKPVDAKVLRELL